MGSGRPGVSSLFTDAIDGFLARRLHQKSALGAYLDPIADKLLLSSSFVVLAMARRKSAGGSLSWFSAATFSCSSSPPLSSSFRAIGRSRRALLGKATTFFEIALVFFGLLGAVYPA